MSHVVLTRWKLKSGKEEDFVSAWARLTDLLIAECGAAGSRLHKGEDGTFVAYTEWPSRRAWEHAQLHAPKSPARALMAAAIEERFTEAHMVVLDERFEALAGAAVEDAAEPDSPDEPAAAEPGPEAA
jgi:heme-degrading monooxygenase HmoA